MTALHTAVQSGQNESVEILIKVGKANVNQSTKDGTVGADAFHKIRDLLFYVSDTVAYRSFEIQF